MPRKKTARTKKSNKRSKVTAQFKKIAQVFILLAFSGLFLIGYSVYKKLTLEMASAFSASSYDVSTQDLYSISYIVLDSFDTELPLIESINFLLVDSSTSKIVNYKVDINTKIDVPGKFGIEPFTNIIALGNLLEGAQLELNMALLNKSLSKLVGYSIDKFIVIESAHRAKTDQLLSGTINWSTIVNISEYKDSFKTDFTLAELYKLFEFIESIPSDRIITKDLSQSYMDNPSLLDEEILDLTFDSQLAREQKSFAILNGSGEAGVASYGSRLISNIGGRVVVVGNSNQIYETSVLIVDDLTSQSTLVAKRLFNINNVILASEARNYNETEISRSDITLILGLDFAEAL